MRSRRQFIAGAAAAGATVAFWPGSAGARKPPRPTTTTSTPAAPTTTAPTAGDRFVSPTGSDSNSGSISSPWRTIQHALLTIPSGLTLLVRGGTYVENVKVSATAMRPSVTVKAYPGERPVISGMLHLSNPSYWLLDGINVTWNSINGPGNHMVKLLGGTGWRFCNAELSHARCYAALLVGTHPTTSAPANGWTVDHNHIHHTYASNGLNQDHLIYVDNRQGGTGVIERNVLAHSPNGRGVKVGPGDSSLPGTTGTTIRYNTCVDNRGPSNVQFSGSSGNNTVQRNLMVGSSAQNVTAYQLTGTNNRVLENVGWQSSAVLANTPGLVDAGGNLHFDPQLNAEYRPLNPAAQGYGAHA